MKASLERLSQIKAPVCVTLVLNTHKTHPENKQDSIHLKNLISEANTRLKNEFGDDIAKDYTEKLNKIANSIDHSHNDLGLTIFVNDDVQEYLRLPISLKDRVIIDKTFATRPIVRALTRNTDYYILALTKDKARFIKASTDSVIEECAIEGFPFENATLQPAGEEAANATKVTNLTQEFFNRVDKAVNKVRNLDPFSVVVYSEETNFHAYMKEADYPNTIMGHVKLQKFDESASNLVKTVWKDVLPLALAKNNARISELESALSSGKYLSDINEIWKAVQEGRGKTIFVEEGYIQAVRQEDDLLTPIAYEDISHKNDIDDIIDEIIEHNLKFGGDIVFLEPGSLEKFNKLALVTRY